MADGKGDDGVVDAVDELSIAVSFVAHLLSDITVVLQHQNNQFFAQ